MKPLKKAISEYSNCVSLPATKIIPAPVYVLARPCPHSGATSYKFFPTLVVLSPYWHPRVFRNSRSQSLWISHWDLSSPWHLRSYLLPKDRTINNTISATAQGEKASLGTHLKQPFAELRRTLERGTVPGLLILTKLLRWPWGLYEVGWSQEPRLGVYSYLPCDLCHARYFTSGSMCPHLLRKNRWIPGLVDCERGRMGQRTWLTKLAEQLFQILIIHLFPKVFDIDIGEFLGFGSKLSFPLFSRFESAHKPKKKPWKTVITQGTKHDFQGPKGMRLKADRRS